VECSEFRCLLLLLRNDLKETMIPHRTKLRELIIQAWREYFKLLRRDLAVRDPYLVRYGFLILLIRLRKDKFHLPWMSGPIKIAGPS
jgi:hypothetical protein